MNKFKYIIPLLLISFLQGCSDKPTNEVISPANNQPMVSADRKTISFPAQSLGLKQFTVNPVGSKGQFISVIAPSHVVASVYYQGGRLGKVVLESTQLNEVYYNYAQAVENRKSLERNFKRLDEMSKQQAATIKELKEGERDFLNSKYAELEALNKLKANGFDPSLVNNLKNDSILLVSDIPENQVGHVESGEEVDIYFNSFAQNKFLGKVIGIGDIIDPVSRTLKVVTLLANKEGKFRPGMFAKIEFGDFNHNIVSVPISSVFTVDGKNYVFASSSETSFTLQEVSLSAYGAENVGILSGLKEGDKVVSQGVLLLKRIIFGH